LITVAQAFDRPETLLIIVRDEAGVMAGVISRTDIVARIGHCSGCSCTEAVEAAMTTDVQTCAPSDPVEDIWSRMKQTGFMHMPVIDGARRPLGVLAARDVLVTLLEDREHEESLLMDYVNGVGYR
jgi:CBS domain-containing protein